MARVAEVQLTATCPRCGYDLRGTVATWTDSCPLNGVCTECGLEFEWVEFFRPELHGEHWNIERVPTPTQLPLALIRTWLRSFAPWSFWSRLTMNHPIRSDRLAQYVIILAFSLLLLYPPIQVTGAVIVRYRQGQILPQGIANTAALVGYLQALQQHGADDQRTRDSRNSLSPEMRQYLAALNDVQRSQVLAMHQQSLVQLQNMSLNVSYAGAVFEALFFPARTVSNYAAISDPYTPPAYLYDEVSGDLQVQGTIGAGGTTWRWYGYGQWSARLRIIPVVGSALLIFAFLMPAGLALLPVSRRTARVRWSHIARIAVYSAFAIHGYILASVLYVWIAYLSGEVHELTPVLVYLLPGCAVLALIIHWAAAISSYLRVPHGAFVSFMLAILSALAMVVANVIWIGWFR